MTSSTKQESTNQKFPSSIMTVLFQRIEHLLIVQIGTADFKSIKFRLKVLKTETFLSQYQKGK